MHPPFSNQIKKPFLQTLQDPVFTFYSLDVKVLRMDAMHPIISGNKWMKLLPWIQLAKQNSLNGIITKGGPWSNHLHAASFSAFTENLSFTAVIKAKENFLTSTLRDASNWGATLRYVDQELYTDEKYWTSFAIDNHQLYIPMGGEGPLAVTGVSNYLNTVGLPPSDYVICPVGTGTTLKGIAASTAFYTHIIGINPGIKDAAYPLMFQDLQKTYPAKSFSFIQDSTLKKFGKWPACLIDQMNSWYEKWQLPSDIIYTAKMFSIFMKAAAAGDFKPGSSILLMQTGGLQGNRSVGEGLLHF
jgi:1-aminocyclopropane-1-carboxylate deaminase